MTGPRIERRLSTISEPNEAAGRRDEARRILGGGRAAEQVLQPRGVERGAKAPVDRLAGLASHR